MRQIHETTLVGEHFNPIYNGKTNWVTVQCADYDVDSNSIMLIRNDSNPSEVILGRVVRVNKYPCYVPDDFNRMRFADFWHLEIQLANIDCLANIDYLVNLDKS